MSNPILMVFFRMYCTAAPRIPRPSDEQFIKHALNVAEALLHYPGSGKYLVLL